MLAVVATTATAGIIVGVVLLTGLGLKISGIIVDLAGGNLFFTVLYAAVAVWMLGLAVPVTASYIIAAVMIAPALTDVGVPEVAAHMFIFYYAVLSEVSPPTALSPFAAAAITGGNPFKTMMLTWKYTLPAFLVPFAFTLSPEGLGGAATGTAGGHRPDSVDGGHRHPRAGDGTGWLAAPGGDEGGTDGGGGRRAAVVLCNDADGRRWGGAFSRCYCSTHNAHRAAQGGRRQEAGGRRGLRGFAPSLYAPSPCPSPSGRGDLQRCDGNRIEAAAMGPGFTALPSQG